MSKNKELSTDFTREMPRLMINGQSKFNLKSNLFHFYPSSYYKVISKNQLKYAKYKPE